MAAGACALGDSTLGVHASPAGETRGKITQFTSISLLNPLKNSDLETLATNRINPVVPSNAGGVVIWDAWTRFGQKSSQEYTHVVRVANYVIRTLKSSFRSILHEPGNEDFKETVERTCKAVLDPLVTSGALVIPASSAMKSPYELEIYQDVIEHDTWYVRPFISVVNVARRMALEPVLIK